VVCITLHLTFCSPSGNDGKSENMDANPLLSIEITNLEEDSLSYKHIKAFEERAMQKLQDLKDYFEIISDSDIEPTFKNQALGMVENLFSSNNNTITLNLDEKQKNIPQDVDSFFVSLKKGSFGILSLQINNISVINNITRLNGPEYKGAIKFRLFIFEKQGNKTNLRTKTNMQCDIIAKKVQKTFGKEKKMVWEVFLGDIYQVP
jgi:hypothetical protein